MWNWAGRPQTQAPESKTEYSRFASTGNPALGLLLACLLTITAHAATDDAGESGNSVLSDAAEPAELVEEAPGDALPPESPTPVPEQSAAATAPALNPNAPLRYVVKKGDTLWDIADHFLKQPWKWPELWYGNPEIKNPHLIYPGDVLYLTYVDGKPRLSREPPSTGGFEKLSPRVREESLQDAIPTIPGDAIRAFLRGPRVVGATELDAAPYIVEISEGHLIGSAGMLAYAKGLAQDAPSSHIVVRKGGVYRDPDSKEILGYEATYTGAASVHTPGDPARINLDTTVREVLIGDRLLPLDETDLLASAYYPHAPEAGIEGYIIAATEGVSQISRHQIVTLNKGARDGVEIGHVFSIYQAGRRVRDPYGAPNATVLLPEEKAGVLMVFKTYERISYALVMKATRSIHLLDKFRTPEN